MRTSRLLLAFVAVLAGSAACSDDSSEVASAPSPCSADGAVTRNELLGGAPAICEHQVLVAELRPRESYALPIRFVSGELMEFCFDDDNDESHRVVIERGDDALVELIAGEGCVKQRIDPGVYDLRLEHAILGAGEDSSPDTIHTQLVTLGDGTKRFHVTSNECRGCDLTKKPWPLLDESVHSYGYAGDYTNAKFTGSSCMTPGDQIVSQCVLGREGTSSSFEGAHFDGTKFGKRTFFVFIGSESTSRVSFANATFDGMHFGGGGSNLLSFKGDFTGATWKDATFNLAHLAGTYRSTTMPGFGNARVEDAVIDAGVYRQLRSRDGTFVRTTVELAASDDLSNITFDGGVAIRWPQANGKLAFHGAKLDGAHLSNITIPCIDGGDLGEASFRNATLDHVTLSNCKLDKAHFDGATLNDVVMHTSSLLDAALVDLHVGGTLDIAGSSVHGNLSLAANTVAQEILGRDVHGALITNDLKVKKLDFFHATLNGSKFLNAQIAGADFGQATLDDVYFTGAILDGAKFGNANGARTHFDKALLRGATTELSSAIFTQSDFDGADLTGALFRGGWICGGSTRGTIWNGVDLGNTMIPRESNAYVVDKKPPFQCDEVAGREPSTTNAATKCPDGLAGPCTTDPRWIPDGYTATCCNPWDGSGTCQRKKPGVQCAGDCDCKSLSCNAGTKTCN